MEQPDKPGHWTAEHENTGIRRWGGLVRRNIADGAMLALMDCNLSPIPVEQLNKAGWRNWEPSENIITPPGKDAL